MTDASIGGIEISTRDRELITIRRNREMEDQMTRHVCRLRTLRVSSVLVFVLGTSFIALPVTMIGQQRPAPSQQPAIARPAAAPYFPERFEWQHKTAEDLGMNSARLADAVNTAVAKETTADRDLSLTLATTFGRSEPFDTPIGPVKARAPANGLITRHGYIVAEWGEPKSVDM